MSSTYSRIDFVLFPASSIHRAARRRDNDKQRTPKQFKRFTLSEKKWQKDWYIYLYNEYLFMYWLALSTLILFLRLTACDRNIHS